MVRKKEKTKSKKFSITLSERDAALLTRYAQMVHLTRPEAIRRIVRSHLRECLSNAADELSRNQLNLFNVDRQTNLLEHIEKIEKK